MLARLFCSGRLKSPDAIRLHQMYTSVAPAADRPNPIWLDQDGLRRLRWDELDTESASLDADGVRC